MAMAWLWTGMVAVSLVFGILTGSVGELGGAALEGAMESLGALLAPALERVGIPPEVAPLLFIRPISGSGALAVGSELMATYGPDSYIGRVAAVMLGSSETTFYTIAVYFGSVGIVKTRYTIPASLCADAVMFLTSAAAVRVLMG